MKTLAATVLSLAALAFAPSASHAQQLSDEVTVAVEPRSSAVTLGEALDLRVDVTNNGTDELGDLIVHIDITELSESTSVDPEDWTATLSRSAGAVAPGQTVSVDWRIQPISAGTFSVYAVVLAPDDDSAAASNVLRVSVDDRRSLNPNGILPVAVGAPALVGGLLVTQLRLSHRKRARPGAA